MSMPNRTHSPPPLKRARPSESDTDSPNGHYGRHQYPNEPHRQQSTVSPNLPALSLSILGVEPRDEFIGEVADFIHHMVTKEGAELLKSGRIEIEAKVGIIKERSTGQRLKLPVLVETILSDMYDIRFESDMTASQHKHFNTMLNRLTQASTSPDHFGSPLRYQHAKLVDSFYSMDGNDRDKIRMTRDEQSGTAEAIRKIRLGDLNIYSPKNAADWRISVNVEIPMAPPVGSATLVRRKDRMSYSHEEFVVDLTQVSSQMSSGSSQVLHELELEIARPELVLGTAMKRDDPNVSEFERSAFDELIRVFVNNARILVRNATQEWR